ncbi:MAG: phosphatidate cytidylyltransferase [Pseudomonadales bacterium]|nr:phosphatidate cytidylyltransferase [Pseudomonadales bacterium]
MLKTRVITACVLVAVLALTLLVLPFAFFALLISAVFVVAAGEWANMSGLQQRWQQIIYAGVIAAVMAVLFALGIYRSTLALAVVLSTGVAGWFWAWQAVKNYPQQKWWNERPTLLLAGFWLLLPAWMGVLYLQSKVAYSGLLWWVIAIIATADIGAYFAGRRFGRHKLAVQVSPGKTWEGFWGGLAANGALSIIVTTVADFSMWQSIGVVVLVLLTSCASVLGDLLESMAKRERGIKDSSQLLPGHGGILDRIDGWTAAIPLFTLMYIFGAMWWH